MQEKMQRSELLFYILLKPSLKIVTNQILQTTQLRIHENMKNQGLGKNLLWNLFIDANIM